MKTKAVMTILLLLLAINLPAQERLTPEEIFRWVPAFNVVYVSFTDYQQARELPGLQEYLDHRKRLDEKAFFNVDEPFTFKDQALSIVKVVAMGYSVSYKFKSTTTNSLAPKELVSSKFDDYSLLQVIRFPPELDLTRQIRKNPKFTRTGNSIFQMYIYQYESGERVASRSWYFCLTPENEIISSTKLKSLKLMIAAGNSNYPSFLEDFYFTNALKLLNGLGQKWSLNDQTKKQRFLYKKNVEEGIQSDFMEESNSPPKENFLVIESMDFSKHPKETRIEFFQDEVLARQKYTEEKRFLENIPPRIKRSKHNYLKLVKTKLELKGTSVIQTIIMDPDFMERYEAFWNDSFDRDKNEKEIK